MSHYLFFSHPVPKISEDLFPSASPWGFLLLEVEAVHLKRVITRAADLYHFVCVSEER